MARWVGVGTQQLRAGVKIAQNHSLAGLITVWVQCGSVLSGVARCGPVRLIVTPLLFPATLDWIIQSSKKYWLLDCRKFVVDEISK